MELELLVIMIVIIGSYTGVDPRIAHSLNVSVFCSVKCLYGICQKFVHLIGRGFRNSDDDISPIRDFFRAGLGGVGGLRDTYDCRGAQCVLSVTLTLIFNNSDIFSRRSEYPRHLWIRSCI